MSDESVNISLEQMKALARYEITFDQLAKMSEIEDGKLMFPDYYKFTLEDLYIALKNIVKTNPTVSDFGEYWYYPLTNLEEAFCINEACGGVEDDDSDSESDNDYEPFFGLPLTEEGVFCKIWYGLEDIWSESDDDSHMKDLEEVNQYIKEIELFLSNKGKPVEEMEFTDEQKKRFIELFESDERVKRALDSELRLCRQFTEELCKKDSGTALHLKGYACYGGNRLYECNWPVSRDCMIRLFEKTDDPQYANTLGYIYYYGRCNGGIPEYEKAFESFSIAAANGLHEGLYKLADMFRHGYACKKSERTARALYGMVYDDCYKQFLEGREGAFADAALRMGNVYSKGIGEGIDPEEAYRYYLQADFAAKRRAKVNNFFGDTNVIIGIQKALEETKTELPDDFFKEYVEIEHPWIFWGICEDGYRAGVVIKKDGDKDIVSVTRLPRRSQKDPAPILLTVPTIDYCDLITGMEMEAYGLKSSFGDHPVTIFKYDSCEWNDAERRIDFYYDEDQVGWLACDHYRYYNKNKSQPSGQLLKLVSISFQPNGRTYDYLCEIPDVEAGDHVIVMGYDGETEVTVQNVYTKYESELGLPLDRYKKVIRKV